MKSQFFERFKQINFDKIIDHPNILIAAKFWDEDRYQAARICYGLMRKIDDLIDNHKAEHEGIKANEKEWFKIQVRQWIENIKENKPDGDPAKIELINTINNFRIPLWTLDNFADAMLYDIDQDGFPTLNSFLKYSMGASVAPSSIFVHLCGIHKHNGKYSDPLFDVQEAARPCAIFSYLVHIIRDFQKDQIDNLNYFADDLVKSNGMSRKHLKNIATGTIIPDGFRALMRKYMDLAESYRLQTLKVIDEITPLLEPAYQLSLHIIYNLYLMVYERIDVEKGDFTTEELNPTANEIKDRVYRTIVEFDS